MIHARTPREVRAVLARSMCSTASTSFNRYEKSLLCYFSASKFCLCYFFSFLQLWFSNAAFWFRSENDADSAHCVLLGTNYTKKKTCLSCGILMNPTHHLVTMTKKIVFSQETLKDKPKKTFFYSDISGLCPLWTNKALGTSQLVPISSPGTSCCQSH